MPTSSPRVICWCGAVSTAPCEHVKQANTERDKSVKHLYDSAVWRKRFSPMMRRLNPICQAIDFNSFSGQREQCHRPSTVVHHLVDPKDKPNLFLDSGNVVCLCAAHHPGGQRGTAWQAGVDYVPTNTPKHSIPRG